MMVRPAILADIPQIMAVRHSVRENQLSDPGVISAEDCIDFLTIRGRGWVSEIEGQIVGFAIVDLKKHNVWALFIRPQYEKRGIGKQLQHTLLDWYFQQTHTTIWLSTSPGTRAEQFYRKSGWVETGKHGAEEIKFEMSYERWQQHQ